MLLDAGVADTAAHITALLDRAAGALEAIGCEVSPAPEHRAGILMIKPAADVDALAEACAERNIAVSVRRGPPPALPPTSTTTRTTSTR